MFGALAGSTVQSVPLVESKPEVCYRINSRRQIEGTSVNDKPKGPASYFPSIEKKYGKPIEEWQSVVRQNLPAKHMELVAILKNEHGMGHGHANAIVAYVLAQDT